MRFDEIFGEIVSRVHPSPFLKEKILSRIVILLGLEREITSHEITFVGLSDIQFVLSIRVLLSIFISSGGNSRATRFFNAKLFHVKTWEYRTEVSAANMKTVRDTISWWLTPSFLRLPRP